MRNTTSFQWADDEDLCPPAVYATGDRMPAKDSDLTPSDAERIERLELAVGTMAVWLVQAQTGFGEQDARGIEKILRGESK